jgi:hypothetical protein
MHCFDFFSDNLLCGSITNYYAIFYSIRSFSNKGRENLVYLRVTDCENSDAGHNNNVAVIKIAKCEKSDSLLDSMVEKVIDLTRWTCRVDATSVD